MAYYTKPNLTFGGSFIQGARTLKTPRAFDPTLKYPLILYLHSYGATGGEASTHALIGISDAFDDGVFLFAPDAWDHTSGTLFWDFYNTYAGSDMDWLANGLVRSATGSIPQIDTQRIWVMGSSNGGFMARQLSQQNPTLFSAGFTYSCAGGTNDPLTQSVPVPWVEYHGLLDTTVTGSGDPNAVFAAFFSGHGGVGSHGYTSITGSYGGCMARNGLTGTMTTYVTGVNYMTTDSSTTVKASASDGGPGTAVESWTSQLQGHAYTVAANQGMVSYGWLQLNHRKS